MNTQRTRVLATRVAAVFSAVLVVAALTPPAASAAPQDVFESIGITLFDLDTNQTPTIVITAQVPTDMSPPVEAALAVPKGATISWIGQILGGDTANDPTLTYTVESMADYDLLHFTLDQSPRAQIELDAPAGTVTDSAEGRLIDLSYVMGGAAARARIGVVTPFTMHMENLTPASVVVEVRQTDMLYSMETIPVDQGQPLRISGLLVSGPAPEYTAKQQSASTESTETTVPIGEPIKTTVTLGSEDPPTPTPTWLIAAILGGVAAILVAVLFWRVRVERRTRQRSGPA